jgi:glyoxalase family protein
MGYRIMGLQYVTALAGDAGRTRDFYTQVLGLRPEEQEGMAGEDGGTSDFPFGAADSSCGAGLRFCTRPRESMGQRGRGQATEIGFSVPAGSLEHWLRRFDAHHVTYNQPTEKFGESYIPFLDPNGLKAELVVARCPDPRPPADTPAVPHAMAIRGIHNVTLTITHHSATADLLTEVFGFRFLEQRGNRFRYAGEAGPAAAYIDLVESPNEKGARGGGGTIHHLTFRVRDYAGLRRLRGQLSRLGFDPTPALRQPLFHSLYFREPGGVLFELAIDPAAVQINDLRAQARRTSAALSAQAPTHPSEYFTLLP